MTIIDNGVERFGTRPATAASEAISAGWHDDPSGRHELRYFDGETWTDHVTHFGPSPCSGCR